MNIKRKLAKAAGIVVVLVAVILAALTMMPEPKGIPILEYHMVDTEEHPGAQKYNVDPEDFKEQMDYLAQQGYTTISIRDFLRAKKGLQELPEKPVILTFDDGYENNYTVLWPILKEKNLKATVFMVTNDIGREGYLTWGQLKEMQDGGIEIGSHTANHLPLTEMDLNQADDELKLSKLIMEWNKLKTIYVFSYPNGSYNDKLPVLLEKNEYLAAVTGDAGYNTFDTNPYLLHRTHILRPWFGLTEFKYRLWKTKIYTILGINKH